jgi:Ca2+-binding EF-hand superfamily protein
VVDGRDGEGEAGETPRSGRKHAVSAKRKGQARARKAGSSRRSADDAAGEGTRPRSRKGEGRKKGTGLSGADDGGGSGEASGKKSSASRRGGGTAHTEQKKGKSKDKARERLDKKKRRAARRRKAQENERRAALLTVFARVDANGDGTVTRAELIKALRGDAELQEMLQLPARVQESQREAFERVFQGMDRDNDREVTVTEFVRFVTRTQRAAEPEDGAAARNQPQVASQPTQAAEQPPQRQGDHHSGSVNRVKPVKPAAEAVPVQQQDEAGESANEIEGTEEEDFQEEEEEEEEEEEGEEEEEQQQEAQPVASISSFSKTARRPPPSEVDHRCVYDDVPLRCGRDLNRNDDDACRRGVDPEVLHVFDTHDADADGRLNLDELFRVFMSMGFNAKPDYVAGVLQIFGMWKTAGTS